MKDLSLYIHIPFCKCICLYCAFSTYANKGAFIGQYFNALDSEIESKSVQFQGYSVKTIYFGGGTPSLIDEEKLGFILFKIRQSFKICQDPEISIECNPETLTAQKLKIYSESGINRITLGVQSLKKETLFRIGRPHDREQIISAINLIKKAKYKNFGTDLIIGLPYQTLKSFKSELKEILIFGFKHLSLYFLSYDTPKIDHFIKDCPDEDEQIRMYEYGCQFLKKAGFVHYEVSNWAQPGFECQHNRRYWDQKEYLGIGLSAHSFINNRVWDNTANFNDYLKNPLESKNSLRLDRDLQRMDHIMLKLRQHNGINLRNFAARYGKNQNSILIKNASSYIQTGHLRQSGNRLFASEKGYMILDKITLDLI